MQPVGHSRSSSSSSLGYDIIVLSIVDYETRFQRPQQIAARFAKEGRRVFWVSHSRRLSPFSRDPYKKTRLQENLWDVQLRGPETNIYEGSLDTAAQDRLLGSLAELYRQCSIAESCVMVQMPFWRPLALALRSRFGARVLYDCMDEWEEFPRIGPFNLSQEKLLAKECDVLVVTSQTLFRKFSAQGAQPLLVRNAVDFEFFTKRPEFPDVSRPVVGYFGAIADWVDLQLIHSVAQARPQYSFVLVGEVFGMDVSDLQSLPNVFLLWHKQYEEMPFYLRKFDVCIIPFLINQITEATDPVKLYEYLSHGKPVVATDLPELSVCEDLVYTAKDASDFAAKLDSAVAENEDYLKQRRIDFAAANTWYDRIQLIDQTLQQEFSGGFDQSG